MSDQIELQQIIGQVAAAYFNNNHVAPSEISVVIGSIATAIAAVGGAAPIEALAEEPEPAKLTPAQIRRSITQDNLISFEDNKGYKTLRRHLAVRGLTPEDYRSKWGLPKDYPMVAPGYREARSKIAKAAGFGNRTTITPQPSPPQPAAASAAPAPVTTKPPRPRAVATKSTGRGSGNARASKRVAKAKSRSTSEPTA